MAQKIILTKIKQRFDTLANWQSVWTTLTPEAGEICIFKIPANTSVDGLPQSNVVRHISKTGDGSTTLKNLPWDSSLSLSTISVETSDDNVVNLNSTNGTNSATISASHAEKGPSAGYTSGNTITSITGAGTSGTIKIPQITVDKYGHVNSASDEDVTITLPSLNVTDDTAITSEDLSFGESVTLVSNVTKASNDTISLEKTRITLPANPTVTVTQEEGNDLDPSHTGTFDVVTSVTKGTGVREIEVTTQTVTLPAETTLQKATDSTADAETIIVDGITRKGSFTAMTDTIVSGHTVTDVNKTFTIDLSNFATTADISSAMVFKGTLGSGGTVPSLPIPDATTVGDCYKVIVAGTYNSTACTVGDLWVCNDTPSWIHIPSGDDEYKGTVTKVEAGQGLSTGTDPISTSGTISHVDVIRTDDTSTASPAHGGTFTAIDSVTTDTMGHVSAVNMKTVTLPAHTDEKVGGVSTTTAAEYPLLFKNSTGTTTTAAKARFNSGITVNPSTKTITATTFAGNASTTTKFNSARTVALTGDVTGSASNDGSGGWSVATTITAITEEEINALFV